MKTPIVLAVALLAMAPSPASASTISFTAPSLVSGPFDLVVSATDLFAGRDPLTDLIISMGFNVSVSNPSILSFTGAVSGPLFEPATTAPGTNVFAFAIGQNGFGIEPGAAEPLTLATLHFVVLGSGPVNILIGSNLANPFHGLQFLNNPIQESIVTTRALTAAAPTAVPEPATLMLVGIGLVGAALRRRTMRRGAWPSSSTQG